MNKLTGLILLFLFFSCKSDLPKGIIGKEKMQSIYWDMLRADEMVNYYASADTSYKRQVHQDSLYTAIFSIHNISRNEFLQSKAYYEANPELLKPILDSIFNKGERLQSIPDNTPEKASPSVDTNLINKDLTIDTTNKKKGLILKRE
jgi:hypothetical protein